ncbi:hypothetical protein SEPCBS119000_000298 [Sporothrix epigloea]|uniref:NAD(P)-binding protein n=1 Tax=Sporothrix epigloea TaxID=1892477 RepID=A0ABP0D4C6_9PEZI
MSTSQQQPSTGSSYLDALVPRYITHFFRAQWQTVPLPEPGYFAGQTIIITGANAGLGLEAVRHAARLGAARLIVACRSVEKAEGAIADVRQSLTPEQNAACAFEAWDVDMGSFASVAAFARRADAQLDRLDAIIENAGISVGTDFTLFEGYESTITVNVLSTIYLALLLLPLQRRTAAQYNVRPRLTIVSSLAHFMTPFVEQRAPVIFDALKDPKTMSHDRYNVSKLLEVLAVRELAGILEKNGVPVTVNTVNPGLCRTQLFRTLPLVFRYVMLAGTYAIGRTSSMGARTLIMGAAGGPETHGQYMDTGEVYPVSTFVTSQAGVDAQRRVWTEMLGILEGVHPGISKNVE